MRLTSSELGLLATIPHTRETYHTDGTHIYHHGRLVPPDGKGAWAIQTGRGRKVFRAECLAGIWGRHIGAETGVPPDRTESLETHPEVETTQNTSEWVGSDPGASGATTEGAGSCPLSQLGLPPRLHSKLEKMGYSSVPQMPLLEEAWLDAGLTPSQANEVVQALGRWQSVYCTVVPTE